MTEVYIFKFDTVPMPENAPELLPRWRRRRFERLRYAPARDESLAAGLLWRYVMERHGVDPEEPVRFLQAGKPVFARRKDLYFSLSHSRPYAMCAVSDHPVGADVQKIKPVHMSIARRLHFRERDWLAAQPTSEQTRSFFRIWARKEAWVKAVSRDELLSLAQEDVTRDIPGWHFTEYVPGQEHLAAVCAREGDIATVVTVEMDEIFAALTQNNIKE